jgi:solute carrier family 34 (sodium-dependent phosphate cotransporter)
VSAPERSDRVSEEEVPQPANPAAGTVAHKAEGSLASLWAGRILRTLALLLAVALFVLAIEVIKEGASGAALLIARVVELDSMPNALGFGWLAAYAAMSGSPVAAASVAFLATGVIPPLAGLAMIVGSRLGASFIVLFVGSVYVLRGQERRSGLAMGLLSLVVTISTYLPAMALGAWLLSSGVLDNVRFGGGALVRSFIDALLSPVVDAAAGWLPDWALMLAGLAVLWTAFYLFDRALPSLDLESGGFAMVSRLVYRPLVMFLLGAVLTLITLSVSLSLSLLVPLSARGYVRSENAIPYIMGANITTFIDTLLATVLLGSNVAFTVVLTSMLSISAVSLVVLLLFFRHYERGVLALVHRITASNLNLGLFLAAILFVPLLLLLM